MKPKPNLIPRFNLDYNFSDFIFSLKSIFLTDNFNLNYLNSIFGNKSYFFTNSGRTSLFVILRALNLPIGSKVGVPFYSCTAVFDAVIKAGHIPSFIDIDLDNYTMDPDDLAGKIEELNAIVVIHTFGRPAVMDKIEEVAGDIPIIEDCAHSLLSEYKGKKTGTIGVASFFSFRSRKYISAGEGSMIILNNDRLKENFKKEIDLLQNPSKLNETRHSIFTYMVSFLYHKPWFGLFVFPLVSYFRDRGEYNVKDAKKEFKIAKIRRSDLSIFLRKIEVFKENMGLQRKNSFFLETKLQNKIFILPYEKKDTICNYYLFPIMFKNKKERDVAHINLRSLGLDTSTLWSKTPVVARQFYGYKGDCPNAEKCSETILTLPNYYTLSEEELSEITNCVMKLGNLT